VNRGYPSGGPYELAVVVPTRDRRPILLETLARLDAQVADLPVEIIVVDDGSSDGSAEAAADLAAGARSSIEVVSQEPAGPARARNVGLGKTASATCLFLGDDIWPRPGLVARHLEFHRRRPQVDAAMLGLTVPADSLADSEFIGWLHSSGVQFGYRSLRPGDQVPASCFWTSNVSVKTDLLSRVGGFDEAFRQPACEDAELGVRLARSGMNLSFDPLAVGEHFHPTDLTRTLERMRMVGESFRLLSDRAPELPMPRRPGLRHRVKAVGLTVLYRAGLRPRLVRHATWRFLCDEVQREAYWAPGGATGTEPRIGSALARLAMEDPEASGVGVDSLDR
jgi:glycosyltransferase involved in cell wall biosynthesis